MTSVERLNARFKELNLRMSEMTELINSKDALRTALTWCVENDGECLADHPELLARFRELI